MVSCIINSLLIDHITIKENRCVRGKHMYGEREREVSGYANDKLQEQ